MRRSPITSRARRAAVAAASAGFVSCTLPGTALGVYDVTGTLGADTCGAAPSPWKFSVMLSRKDATLYWSWMDASPILSGPIAPDGTATLTGYELHNVDSTEAGMGPCDMQRSDDLTIALGAGGEPVRFDGSIGYTFSAQVGSTCTDQLARSGGMYDTLPCSIHYAITATRR